MSFVSPYTSTSEAVPGTPAKLSPLAEAARIFAQCEKAIPRLEADLQDTFDRVTLLCDEIDLARSERDRTREELVALVRAER